MALRNSHLLENVCSVFEQSSTPAPPCSGRVYSPKRQTKVKWVDWNYPVAWSSFILVGLSVSQCCEAN